MKKRSTTTLQTAISLVFVCVAVVGLATSAFAVPPNEVSQLTEPTSGAGLCCFFWNQTVTIKEGAKPTPLVVTWSTDFFMSGGNDMVFGISVNLGPCQFLGPRTIAELGSDSHSFTSRTFEWVVLPSDGLVPGTNRFDVCGGANTSPATRIKLGTRTLAVRISR
jgi:hypothetical protein